jgi:hypothetical protein
VSSCCLPIFLYSFICAPTTAFTCLSKICTLQLSTVFLPISGPPMVQGFSFEGDLQFSKLFKGAQVWYVYCREFYLNQACRWVGDLESRPKNPRSLCLGLILVFISSDVGYSTKKRKNMGVRSEKKVVLDCFYIDLFGLKRFLWNLNDAWAIGRALLRVCEEIRKWNFIAVRRTWASTQAMVVHHGSMEALPEHQKLTLEPWRITLEQ